MSSPQTICGMCAESCFIGFDKCLKNTILPCDFTRRCCVFTICALTLCPCICYDYTCTYCKKKNDNNIDETAASPPTTTMI